jgi:hypothetical protein
MNAAHIILAGFYMLLFQNLKNNLPKHECNDIDTIDVHLVSNEQKETTPSKAIAGMTLNGVGFENPCIKRDFGFSEQLPRRRVKGEETYPGLC